MPNRDDGGNGEDSTDKTGANYANQQRNSAKKKAFDLAAFHQLRLERFENKKRVEDYWRHRNIQKSQKHWTSTGSSPLISMTKNSTRTMDGSRPFRAFSSSIETKDADRMLAQQELLRLGKRYASFSSSPSSTEQSRRTSSEHREGKNVEENTESGRKLFPFSDSSSSGDYFSDAADSSVALEKAVTQHSEHVLDIATRSSSVPLEALQRVHDGISLVTPDDKSTSKEDVAVYGSHYLLLARTNSLPTPSTSIADQDGHSMTHTIDADDGSSSASYNTPTPFLQAASASNSHGDNEDGSEVQENVEEGTDHFSSFCKAQMLISEMEDDTTSKQLQTASRPTEVDASQDYFLQLQKANFQIMVYCAVRCALITIGGATLYFYWRPFATWSKINYQRISHLLSSQLDSWLGVMSPHSWSFETIQNAIYSKVAVGITRATLIYGHAFSSIASWAKMFRDATVTVYRDWTKDIDILSWIIHNIYRLEKVYYDSLQLFNFTKYRLLEIQDASVAAWNATFSVIQHLEIAPMSYFFYKSKEPIEIRKTTTTAPIIFSSNNECISKIVANATLALFDTEDDVEATTTSSSTSQFWRRSISGTPFVRHKLPSMSHDYRRNIVPSRGTQHKQHGDSSASSDVYIFTGSRINEHQHPKERSKYLSSVVGLSRPHFTFDIPRFDGIVISSDLRKNIPVSMIMQNSRPHHTESVPQESPSQAIVPKGRNYYTSSYPATREQSYEKDVFEDVDVMGMAREYVGQLLKRRSSDRNRRRKKSGR